MKKLAGISTEECRSKTDKQVLERMRVIIRKVQLACDQRGEAYPEALKAAIQWLEKQDDTRERNDSSAQV